MTRTAVHPLEGRSVCPRTSTGPGHGRSYVKDRSVETGARVSEVPKPPRRSDLHTAQVLTWVRCGDPVPAD